MIASLRGKLIERSPEAVIVDVGGVGYLVHVPLNVFERLPTAGKEIVLHTELVVREDAWSLYGFDNSTDKVIFGRLLGASGVGAKLALAMISSLGASRTVAAIQQRDLAALSTVPGIGKKKAERISLELADKFGDLPGDSGADQPIASPAAAAVRGLVGLGYPLPATEAAIRKISTGDESLDVAALIRRGLSELRGE